MNLDELTEIFRSEVDDLDAQAYLWTEDDVLDYANDAQNEACRRARLLKDASTAAICQIAVVAGTASYALDPRVIFVLRAKLSLRSLPLARMVTKDLSLITNWETHTGQPRAFVPDWETGKLLLYRNPTDNDTLNLRVVRLPLAEMTNSDDVPEINARYQRSLRYWMMFRAYSKQDTQTRDPKKAAESLALFEHEFGKKSPAIDEEWIEQQYMVDDLDGTY